MLYTEAGQVSKRRRGVILLVVLAMLTLFAILGIAFVIYAESAANEARLAREGEQTTRPDINPQIALSFILGQIIYDVPDPLTSSPTTTSWGTYSALRGQSLGRNIYGWNSSGINDKPYCGPGRIDEGHAGATISSLPSPFNTVLASNLINYTPYINAFTPDSSLRDPERLGTRASFGTAPGTYLACNVPYTYPDQQNMFLAAIKADGTLLVPSYHRPWIFDSTNPANSLTDMTNANWTNTIGKYLLLRPRPCDMAASTALGASISPATTTITVASSAGINTNDTLQIDSEQLLVTAISGTTLTVVRGVNGTTAAAHSTPDTVYDIHFPYPDENGGDVKNLTGFPGGNDSIWIDIDAPEQIAPDGTKFKMLVAPLILDLDNRINLGAAGNILGVTSTTTAHASNQGWGPWEVNPSKILNNPNVTGEWTQIFTGVNNTIASPLGPKLRVPGRYGPNGVPNGAAVAQGEWPTGYAQIDFNAITDPASPPSYTGSLSTNFLLPGATGTNTFQCFPSFPSSCYNNGNTSSTYGDVETTNHPLTYNVMRANSSTGDDRVFSAYHTAGVLLLGSTNSDAYNSDLLRLLPNNLGYLTSNLLPVSNSPSTWTTQFRARNLITTCSFDLDRPGVLPYSYYDSSMGATDNYTLGSNLYPSATALSFPTSSTLGSTYGGVSEFDISARSILAALGRVDLNRQLTDYPYVTDPNFTTTRRFDTTNPAVMAQVNQANTDRQQFAQDILNRLVVATGALYGASPDPKAIQWLAQLAVNIVDYIDTDDVSTVFNYSVTPPSAGAAITGTVYGTELPRLVINETYVQWDNNPADAASGTLTNPNNVNVYVELFNTMPVQMPGNSEPPTRPAGDDGFVILQTDQGPVYQLVLNDIANATALTGGGTTTHIRDFSNTKGDPDTGTGVCGNALAAPFQPFTAAQGWGASGTVGSGTTPNNDQAVGPCLSTSNFSSSPPTPYSGYGWYVIGPNTANVYNAGPSPAMDPSLTTITPQANAAALTYTVPNTATTLPAPTILLRRLANPYLPNNESTTTGTTPYNPFITVDYMQTSQSIAGSSLTTPTLSPATTTLNVTNDDRVLLPGGTSNPNRVAPGSRFAWGRRQPYAGLSTTVNTQLIPQIPSGMTGGSPWPTTTARNTFFSTNAPDGTSATATPTSDTLQVPYDWLVHLDRQLISPMELLHVSGFKPHELTQQFVQANPNSAMGTDNAIAVMPNQHVARWTDPSTRLARALEALTTKCRANGVALGGRIPGRVNINTVFDVETFRALCDAQAPNMFYGGSGSGDTPVNTIFSSLIAAKTPNWNGTPASIGPNSSTSTTYADRPFLGMAVGWAPGTSSDELPYNVVATRGVDYTLLTANTPPTTPSNAWPASVVGGTTAGVLLLEPNSGGSPTTPNTGTMSQNANFIQLPYQRSELLRKIFNNLTTRSNVYGVWLTVGFFQVTNDTVRPIQLGPEIGKSENRQVRHHMFAIVDRTNLQLWPTVDPNATTVGTAMVRSAAAITLPSQTNNNGPGGAGSPTTLTQTFTAATISLINSSGTAITTVTNPYTNSTWTLGANTVLTYDPDTDNEETVFVQSNGTGGFQANFYKNHLANCTVISRGNPGPWPRYDPRNDTAVVPYFTIID
jgi:hypothetical protein